MHALQMKDYFWNASDLSTNTLGAMLILFKKYFNFQESRFLAIGCCLSSMNIIRKKSIRLGLDILFLVFDLSISHEKSFLKFSVN